MLAFCGAEEVSDYCEKLISEVGKEGGFILSSGCEVPLNAKLENVRAMMEAAARTRSHVIGDCRITNRWSSPPERCSSSINFS